MAEWHFDVLDNPPVHEADLWAGSNGLEYAADLGEHWSSDTWAEPPPEPAGNAQPITPHTQAQAPLSSPPRSSGEDGVRLPPILSPTSNPHPSHASYLPDNRHEVPPRSHGPPFQQRQSHSLGSAPEGLRLTDTGSIPQASRPGYDIDPSTLDLINPGGEQEQGHRTNNSHSHALEPDSEDNMSSSHRRQSRNGGQVDLTSSPNLTTAPDSQQRRTRKRSSTSNGGEEGSASKRTKRSAISRVTLRNDDEEEDEAPSAEDELLKAQQQEALRMQEEDKDESALKVGQRTCIICLENFTNATISNCGHIFCHECLTRALMASEKNNERGSGNCPACRKQISRKKANHVIPINFMKRSAFKSKGRQPHTR